MMSDEKSKYGVTIKLHDFGQKTFETYQEAVIKASRDAFIAFDDRGSTGVTASAKVRGETVREALRMGIITGLDMGQVNEMAPYIVTWIADELKAHITAVTTAPTDPN